MLKGQLDLSLRFLVGELDSYASLLLPCQVCPLNDPTEHGRLNSPSRKVVTVKDTPKPTREFKPDPPVKDSASYLCLDEISLNLSGRLKRLRKGSPRDFVKFRSDDVRVERFEGSHQIVADFFALSVWVGGNDDFVKLHGNPLQRLYQRQLVPLRWLATRASIFGCLLATVWARLY